MALVCILFSFVSASAAGDLLAASLVKHLNIHQLVAVGETYDGWNAVEMVKSMSRRFILSQVYQPVEFRKAVPGLIQSTLVKTSSGSFVKTDLIDYFPGKLSWLLPTEDASQFPYIPLDSDVWTPRFDNNYLQLNTIYQISRNSPVITEYYGSYSEKLGLHGKNLRPNVLRRNLQGMPFIIYVPLLNIREFKTGLLHYELWQDFSQALNFTVVYADEKAINEIYHGKYDGQAIIAPFHAIASNRPTSKPNDKILAPILKGWVYMYMKDALGTHGDNWLSYIRPFHTQVWICLAGWLLLFSLVTMIMHHFFGYSLSNIIETGLTPLDAICCQGATVPTASQKSRITAFMPQLVAAVIFPAYAAAIVSFLTVHIQEFPFRDIEGLLQDGTYRLGYLNVDFFCRALIQNNEDLRRVQVPWEELMDDYGQNMARMCHDKKFTFLAYNNLFLKNAKACKFLQIPAPVTFLFTGLPLAEDSPYLPALRWVLIKMHSNGMIRRAKTEVAPLSQNPDQEFDPIPLEQVVVPFLILIIGISAAPLIFICELVLKRHPPKKKLWLSSNNQRLASKL